MIGGLNKIKMNIKDLNVRLAADLLVEKMVKLYKEY